MQIALAHPRAILPTRATAGSVGLDLSAVEGVTIPPHSYAPVSVGIQVKIPAGHYGRIAPRSGLACKHGVGVLAGVVDPDFRGIVKVVLINHDPSDMFEVKIGDRIAQLILERCSVCEPLLVDTLDATDRGDGGFGSSGR